MSRLLKRARRFLKRAPIANPMPLEVVDCRKVGFKNDHENGWFRRDTSQLADGFPISSEDVVIDVGCGDGGISAFAGDMGARVIAVDIDPKAVESTGRRLAKSKARSFEVHQSDSNPLPVPDGICTRVIALEVLEHVDDPASFIAELVRVATPDALFLIAVPDPNSETVQMGIAPPAYWQKPNHVRVFQHEQLDSLIQNAGLHIESRSCKNFFWAMWWSLFWATGGNGMDTDHPILNHWTMTWHHLLQSEKGKAIARNLDRMMPKSQVIVARKAA